jgi:hypothetical protein
MKKKTISKELCADFNKFRAEHCNLEFSTTQIAKVFRDFGFKSTNYLTVAVRLGILIRTGKGKYQFSKEPVHIKKLESLAEEVRRMFRKSKKTLEQNSSEEVAIQLLKELGYKISKPQIDTKTAMENPNSPVKDFIKWITI